VLGPREAQLLEGHAKPVGEVLLAGGGGPLEHLAGDQCGAGIEAGVFFARGRVAGR